MKPTDIPGAHDSSGFQLLSQLILAAPRATPSKRVGQFSEETCDQVLQMSQQQLDDLKRLAEKNHVIVRTFRSLQEIFAAGGNAAAAQWTANALQHEHARIDHALNFLQEICTALEKAGCRPTVIKSLDPWPRVHT